MSLLLSVNQLQKTMGSKLLFEDLSFGINEREQLGLLGPNGAGKSTLLRMLAGEETVDEGTISYRKGLRLALVKQEENFTSTQSILQAAIEQIEKSGMDAMEAQVQATIQLDMAGFEDVEKPAAKLSGGWAKRLSLAIAFSQDPDLIIMDEPTNHMDWDGILWLESRLKAYKKSFLIVSHDREFLDRVCNKTMEINPLYKDGFIAFDCSYKDFLVKKESYIQEQLNLQSVMSNKARREVEWLRAGVKARTTKSQARIKEAHQLLDDLSDIKARNRAGQVKVRLEIDTAGKLSKKLLELKKVSVAFGDNCLIKDLNLLLGPKTCLGLLGDNGSGKSSLLKVISGLADNYDGEIFRASDLKMVYFDQKRDDLPQDVDLVHYLGDGSDYIVFKNKSIHVSAYASRFLFASEKMKLKISQLSGGEQARLLIAKLLLQPADVLILDEPTNDLDIDTIEILEDTLVDFSGLVILVSHDRYFLSQLCHKYLALDGKGGWQTYASLEQWLRERSAPKIAERKEEIKEKGKPKEAKPKRVKLSYKEQRLLETIDQDIQQAEEDLAKAQQDMENPEIFSDKDKMQQALTTLQEKQQKVDELYSAWANVEEKLQR